jgi:hypothetical protein
MWNLFFPGQSADNGSNDDDDGWNDADGQEKLTGLSDDRHAQVTVTVVTIVKVVERKWWYSVG